MSRVSVILASHGRPALLARCLTGVGQLCYRDFEIVVVADTAGAQAVTAMGWAHRIKLVVFDEANISAARNAGIVAAAGEIAAFIDDDAVPEPTWLDQLTRPFGDPAIAAAGGYVLGRNGISPQWKGRAVNRLGETTGIATSGVGPFEPVLPEGLSTKTEGTNMAFRRSVLAGLGGFDPALRYYLDETDVNLRLAAAGGRTVLVPRALVHHGYAASARRGADRAPRDLGEVGASVAVFLRKHAAGEDHAPALARLAAEQRRALLRHMVAGGLEPRDVGRLLAGLEAGMREGAARRIDSLPEIGPPQHPFRPFRRTPRTGESHHLAGWSWQRRALRAAAAETVARGHIVTVFRFSPTALRHRVRFHPGGWWEQAGGLFGASNRDGPRFRITRFRTRVAREWARVRALRQCR